VLDIASPTCLQWARFSFGENAISFASADVDWLGLLETRYREFRDASASACFTVRFEPTAVAFPPDLEGPLAVHQEELRCRRTPAGFRVDTETSSCDIDLIGREAVLRGPAAMYPLDNLLRYLLPLLWKDGVIVHAAALLARDGGGLIASGASGAGKSTLARLASGQSLCDELAAIRVEGERPGVVSLPFWESRPGRAGLRAILLLEHGERHRLEPLRPEAALRRLATHILWPVWDETAMARSFAHLARLVEAVPAFVFHFAPRPDALRFLEEELR
jgi:hypothetical protein